MISGSETDGWVKVHFRRFTYDPMGNTWNGPVLETDEREWLEPECRLPRLEPVQILNFKPDFWIAGK